MLEVFIMSGTRENADPSQNPADTNSMAGMLQFVFKKLMQSGVSGMLPAQVIQVSAPNENRVQVQILVQILDTVGNAIDRQQVASIPVLQLGGGGFMMNVPIKTGDFGWICANDRDISNFLASYTNGRPATDRMFSFSDGLFIPHQMTNFNIADSDADNLVLQSIDGTTKISIGDGIVKIIVPSTTTPSIPTEIDVTATGVNILGILNVSSTLNAAGGLVVTGNVTGVGGAPLSIVANINLLGNLAVTGNITATGTITPGV
jgi:hypothetical protein